MLQIVSIFRPYVRQLGLVTVAVVALYVLLPQLGDFRSSWHVVRHPDSVLLVPAAGLTLATYAAAAGTYCFLAARRLPFGRTMLVQLAAMFLNRLVPAGIGALGTNYLYLRQAGHRAAQASGIVGLNNTLGFAGHALVLTTVLALSSSRVLPAVSQPSPFLADVLKVLAGAALIGIGVALIWGRRRLGDFIAGIWLQLSTYRHRPRALAGALLTSALLTLCNVYCLVFCLLAVNVHLPLAVVVLVFSFGVGAGVATPTPGGLGGFEAGLAAGLVAYRVDHATALAAALLYRLVSYWLPLLAGAVAFVVCQKQKWLGTTKLRSV